MNALAQFDNRALVDAGALVGAGEFDQLIGFRFSPVVADRNMLGVHADHFAFALGQHDYARVNGALVLDAGCDNGRFRRHQRHCLPLHVCAHQGPVRIVVLQERNHGGCHGDHHLGADIHIVDAIPIHIHDLIPMPGGNTGIEEVPLLVHRLGGLRDNELIFLIGGKIVDLVGNCMGLLIHAAERCNQESVFIRAGVGGKVGNQADVRSFRRLNGAQASVMAVVYVADIEVRSLPLRPPGPRADMRRLCVSSASGFV